MIEFKFSVPLIPPSVNHYKKPRAGGGWFVTKDAKAFIDAVCIFSGRPKCLIDSSFYEVGLTLYVEARRLKAGDIDNFFKVSFDALAQAGIIRDDRYITRCSSVKLPTENRNDERTEFVVRGRSEP